MTATRSFIIAAALAALAIGRALAFILYRAALNGLHNLQAVLTGP